MSKALLTFLVVFILRVFFLFLERVILLQLKQMYAAGEVTPSSAQLSSGSLGAGQGVPGGGGGRPHGRRRKENIAEILSRRVCPGHLELCSERLHLLLLRSFSVFCILGIRILGLVVRERR